jgi:hypothetical protein
MRRFILYLSLMIAVVSFVPFGAEAQVSQDIERLEVSLWPEYDQHAVLVIYRVYLASDSELPAVIRLPIPTEVGDPYAVAWLDDGGQLLVADYESELRDEWTIITLTANSLIAQLEYYMDYDLEGMRREFVFQWPEGFALESMSYEVQQPPDVSDLQVNPAPDEIVSKDDGLRYLQADLGRIPSNVLTTIELGYSNPGGRLTVDVIGSSIPLPVSTPVDAEGSTPDVMKILPWVVGGIGLSLVLIGGFLSFKYWSRPVRVKARSRTGTRPQRVVSEEGDAVDASVVYCHKCGTKASVSDRFCRHCGTRLRR